ncbi:MAG TPA: hypothetical protein VJU86_00380 [Pyrinomonadaceae bacterium]|nr:hypothetical protein [Pyrinomonadaceae bacterium]
MSHQFSLRQKRKPAVLIKLETDLNAQLHLAELELDEGLHEIVFHVFDETLRNFIAKRISLNIHAAETPFAPPAVNELDNV